MAAHSRCGVRLPTPRHPQSMVTYQGLSQALAPSIWVMRRRLSRREPPSVVADSAGWPIALRIYRNALRHGTRGAGGPDRTVAGWIETPLWRGIPDAERDFVLDVARFDRLDPALSDEVTGEGNAARRIASRGTLAWLWSGSERGARRPAYVRRPAQQSFDATPLSGGLFALRRSHEPRKLPVHQTATRLHATRYVRAIGVQRKKLIEGGAAARCHQPRGCAGEVNPLRSPQHSASVVGAAPAGSRPGSDLRTDGR